jgi:hypothetical protein
VIKHHLADLKRRIVPLCNRAISHLKENGDEVPVRLIVEKRTAHDDAGFHFHSGTPVLQE